MLNHELKCRIDVWLIDWPTKVIHCPFLVLLLIPWMYINISIRFPCLLTRIMSTLNLDAMTKKLKLEYRSALLQISHKLKKCQTASNFNLFVSQVPAVKKAEFFKITETTFFSWSQLAQKDCRFSYPWVESVARRVFNHSQAETWQKHGDQTPWYHAESRLPIFFYYLFLQKLKYF